MLVGFAVQLKVGLQVGLVCAQFADVCARYIHRDLSFTSLAASVHRKMRRQTFKAICAEILTYAAVVELGGVGIDSVPFPCLRPTSCLLPSQPTAVVARGHQLEEERLIVRQIHHHHVVHVTHRRERRPPREVAPMFRLHKALQHLEPLQLLHVLLDRCYVLDMLVAGHVNPQVSRQTCFIITNITTPRVLLRKRMGSIESLSKG